MFVDDIILSIGANDKSCRHLLKALKSYSAIMGLQVSKGKSEILFPKSNNPTTKHHINNNQGIKDGSWPLYYPGAYIHYNRLPNRYQDIMIEKVLARFQGWNYTMFSQIDKSILINSVINTIPLHILKNTWISDSNINNIIKLSRNFLWNNNPSHKKMPLLSWDCVTDPKWEGGLRLSDLHLVKSTTGTYKLLPLLNKEDYIWDKLLLAKYGPICLWSGSPPKASCTWKGLSRFWPIPKRVLR